MEAPISMTWNTDFYLPPNPKLWTGRVADPGSYWYQVVECRSVQALEPASADACYAFLGYACDEGVRQNQGRVGAAEGPDAIRPFLARLPIHFDGSVQLFDLGNVACPNGRLEETQEELGKIICHLLQWRYRPILLGGGHDIAYGHYLGIRRFLDRAYPGKKLGILNLDAHFDLRKPIGGAHSGTPFLQIAERERALERSFYYLVAGIRKAGNTRILFETASQLGAQWVEREDMLRHPETFLRNTLPHFLDSIDSLYLTIDLDSFSAAFAPGVSAPASWGLHPDLALQILNAVKRSGKLLSMDVAEFNPKYDIDGRTARLASEIVGNRING